MIVGDYGFLKRLRLTGPRPVTVPIETLRVVFLRPDETTVVKLLTAADDLNATTGDWLIPIDQGDLNTAGTYSLQAFDVATDRQIGTSVEKFEVGAALE